MLIPAKVKADSLETVEVMQVTQEEAIKMATYPEFSYSRDWTDEEAYLLAKIAKAEAGSENTIGKTLVIMSVLNRVNSETFPDSITDVIYQAGQFSTVNNSSFKSLKPDEDCIKAVELVKTALYDYSEGAMYFESCKNADNWHSRNLEFLFKYQHHKFYK